MKLTQRTLALAINSIPRGVTRENFTLEMMEVDWDIPEAVPLSEEGILYLEVTRTENEILVRGDLQAEFSAQCSRCLDPVTCQVEEGIERIYSWDPEMLEDPEVEPVSHNDGSLSILDAVREAVILSIPTVPLCDGNCMGLCPVCGINRNRENCSHNNDNHIED